ncbi:MAG: GNAT family N-acetyltransferase [bacterium]|nr:GNAT family N-acetyltransferase [bacterium]
MHIREFQESDAKRLSQIIKNSITRMLQGEEPQQDWHDCDEYFSPEMIIGHSQVRQVLVVEEDGELYGIGSMRNDIISSVFIDPQYSRRGIGQYLLEYMEDTIKKQGYKSVIMTTAIQTAPYFRKFGYCESCEEEEMKDGIVMLSKIFATKPEPSPV